MPRAAKDVQTIAVRDDLHDAGGYLDELGHVSSRNKDAPGCCICLVQEMSSHQRKGI